ncbi:aspartate/glutamate racemase family protein [Pseudomonas sp. 10B1]|uniref:aspartate/glutamate racemase family protein n=1 Tax=unclassified Pseudomonas TaxID=196821 RepID=UPI002AB56536|nr:MULTISPECIES: aspartate/glutamate racemase family protein [unclassified Pseudomonas]MDY7559835.1 aspartate/glutamate racemase family protein [Pseudomonas sp. AB6]MEA9976570.1 aspartate/glutamate racemase family protein [Pseudomonas sp. RTS4]MEA9992927.1 aspartate/glutamate racemase family protein [Pseudomonas sp. AA4]MEB0089102.1 aspartate/glutamate racemase family protein [Pseudomonas sp. RTI1]MEB0125695.1 aspartate/glutamate racemase family protein [Pseudomonas sp. CCC1.2]
MRITCLHTAESNIAVFDLAAKELGIGPEILRHEVRADLLAAAERAGGLTADLLNATQLALFSLAQHADAVALTCSTLGPAIEGIANAQSPILRVDEALASAAVHAGSAGGKVVVLCAVETTIDPTSRLFLHAAQGSNALVEVQLVSGAWALFKSGDLEGYLAAIAKAVDAAYIDGASVVALAQASMSGAASLVTAGPPPLTSATAGLRAALEVEKKDRS